MTQADKLLLKWPDFQENLSSSVQSIKDNNNFIDVTLVSEDGQEVKAHKILLAASSPFFYNLLKRNNHSHPIIYMRGIKSEYLFAIIDFLYRGETRIGHEFLDNFLNIANELRIKGLAGQHSDVKVHSQIGISRKLMPDTKSKSIAGSESLENQEVNGLTKEHPLVDGGHIDFLKIADELKIKGLAGQQSNVKVHSEIDISHKLMPDTKSKSDVGSESLENKEVKGLTKEHPLVYEVHIDSAQRPKPVSGIDRYAKYEGKPIKLYLEEEFISAHELQHDVNSTDLHNQLSVRVKSMMGKSKSIVRSDGTRREYSCHMCAKTGQWNTIRDHIEANHIEGISLPCKHCSKSFKSRDSLRKHKPIHAVEKHFSCNQCHRSFARSSQKKSHERGAICVFQIENK